MRLHNHSEHEIAHVLVDVHHDPAFDTVDIDINISDLDIQEYEEVMQDIIRVFKKYNIKIVRD